MTKLEIFDDIVSIMAKDSATSKDKGVGDFEAYRSEISEEMSSDSFILTVRRYLATFCVPGHLYFGSSAPGETVGFSVRRIEDVLYVTEAEAGTSLTPGDRIIALDGLTIPEAAAKYRELLYNEPCERQHWGSLLPLFARMSVVSGSETKELPMAFVEERTRRAPYECRAVNETTLLLRFDDFGDESAIHNLIHSQEQEIARAENLIVDVRRNAGGSDTAFLPLLNYCFAVGEQPDSHGAEAEMNYSERTVDTRIAMFEEYLKEEVPAEVREILENEVTSLRANRGRGYFRGKGSDFDFNISGTEKPGYIYVLTDCDCGSSGDAFVEILRSSSKVTVVGRPTMGILDYSNLAYVTYDDYLLGYPTSRRLALDQGIAMGGHGVPVDVYIPFTAEEIHRDVMMERVFELIGKQS